MNQSLSGEANKTFKLLSDLNTKENREGPRKSLSSVVCS